MLNILSLEPPHATAELINKQKLSNPMLSQVMRNAEQRDASKTRLRDDDVELEALVLIPLAVSAMPQLQHCDGNHQTDGQEHDPRQSEAPRGRLVEPEEGQKSLEPLEGLTEVVVFVGGRLLLIEQRRFGRLMITRRRHQRLNEFTEEIHREGKHRRSLMAVSISFKNHVSSLVLDRRLLIIPINQKLGIGKLNIRSKKEKIQQSRVWHLVVEVYKTVNLSDMCFKPLD